MDKKDVRQKHTTEKDISTLTGTEKVRVQRKKINLQQNKKIPYQKNIKHHTENVTSVVTQSSSV